MPKPDFALFLITDRKLCRPRQLQEVVREAATAGVKAIQLREKDLPARDLFHLSQTLVKICAEHNVHLLINDRVDLAAAVGAAGVHLTSRSLPVSVARRQLGKDSLIGVSTHSRAEAQNAAEQGCDFILFGPVFDTPSKRRYGPPQGLARLEDTANSVEVPVVAVGGINPERARTCLEHGASAVAVISAIMGRKDVAKAVTEFKECIGRL